MELCSIAALVKDVHRRAVESAFLMLVEPANPVATMEVDIGFVGTNGEDGSIWNGLNRWDKFCDKFADVFKPTGFPVKYDFENDIELLPGATP